jgi:tetratricopeptide (TPR) repeat protein
VIAELRTVADGDAHDDAKCVALALLAELGEPATHASFHDPRSVTQRSLGELSELLTRRSDVALAADLIVTQLDGDGLLELVESLAQSQPGRTRHLVDELVLRTDLDPDLRSELVRVAAPIALVAPEPLHEPARRAPRTLLLRHKNGKSVSIVLRRDDDHWRCLVVLVDAAGHVADALYREDIAPRAVRDELLSPLTADGFVETPTRFASMRAMIAAAARRTVLDRLELPGAYYLGRDLLALGDAHQPDWRARWEPDLPTTLLGRATDLLAAGEVEKARPLLERCVELVPDDAEAAASFGLCLLGHGDLDAARVQLERAANLEPSWPLHHWNLAAIAHRQGRLDACYLALRTYARLSAADPDRAHRLPIAQEFIADHLRLGRIEKAIRGRARNRPARSAPGTAPSRARPRAARRPRR